MNMYKILIVDDEQIIRDGIKNCVDWSAFNCTIIGLAKTGTEALQMIAEFKPNIVLIDIKMPDKTGLEVIADSKSISPDTKYIIISGYSDFKYAKDAMRYGVMHYLLKPAGKLEIEEALAETISIIDPLKDEEIYNVLEHEFNKSNFKIDSNNSQFLIQKVCNYIDDNLDKSDISLGIIAHEVAFMNSAYLGRLFKEHTGQFYTQYVMNCRINKAKVLLKDSNLKISEIANRVGFAENNKYFLKVFKKHTGCTPLEYRNNLEVSK